MEVRFLLIFQIIQHAKHEDMHVERQINLQYMHLYMSHIRHVYLPQRFFLIQLETSDKVGIPSNKNKTIKKIKALIS